MEGDPREILEGGRAFLLEEPRPQGSIQLFRALHEHTGRSLLVSRVYPERINGLPLETARYWLTQSYGTPGAISPNNIPRLNVLLSGFLERDQRGVILLEGIEYLATQNDFNSILRLVQLISDKTSLSRSTLLVTVDPLAFAPTHSHLLRRELEPVEPPVVREIISAIGTTPITGPVAAGAVGGHSF